MPCFVFLIRVFWDNSFYSTVPQVVLYAKQHIIDSFINKISTSGPIIVLKLENGTSWNMNQEFDLSNTVCHLFSKMTLHNSNTI